MGIIQARTGSTRLPGKVLAELAGEPMLGRVVNRTHRAMRLDEVVIATTREPGDEAIAQICVARGWPFLRGSENDVLDRYYRAAVQHKADAVVRITSDCPLIDPEVIDRVVGKFVKKGPVDYASNTIAPRTFPRGLDVEVIGFEALERAWREDANPAWREHVTPYIYRQPGKFGLRAVRHHIDYSSMRWTVDTVEDLTFVRRVYDHFRHDNFSWRDVLPVLDQYPEWLEINRHIKQKTV